MKKADVVIIGAGIVGLSSGYWLAKAGAKVVILDKGRAGWEASGRATGFLSLRGEQPTERNLAAAAEKLWPSLDEELGYPTEWLGGGRMWVAIEADRWRELAEICPMWQASGIPVAAIAPERAREIAPGLSELLLGALYTERAGHANPQRATQAFAWAFRDRGGEILENAPAIGIKVAGGKVLAVEAPCETIHAGAIVNCAGPQAGAVASMAGVRVPLAAARLEAAVTAPIARLFDVAMVGNGLSLRQTRRGNIHFNGGPHEWIDPEAGGNAGKGEAAKPSTPILRNIGRRLVELFPALASTPMLRAWAGIVDVTPDQSCIVERMAEPEGLILAIASGHGFGLAPSIGQAVAGLALESKSPIEIGGLSLKRFENLDPDWKRTRRWLPGNYNT